MSRKIIEVTVKVRIEVTANSNELGEAQQTLHLMNKIARENFLHTTPPKIDTDISYSNIKD